MAYDSHKAWLKRLELKEIHINMGMFDFGVNVIIGKRESIAKYVQFKHQRDIPEDEFIDGFGYTIHTKEFNSIIWIPRYPRGPREYATLSHECLHIVFNLANWANIELCEHNEEVFTHALGYLVKKILESKNS